MPFYNAEQNDHQMGGIPLTMDQEMWLCMQRQAENEVGRQKKKKTDRGHNICTGLSHYWIWPPDHYV